MFLITVKTFHEQILYFKVVEYDEQDGRISFIDSRTGLSQSFPTENCIIQQVEK